MNGNGTGPVPTATGSHLLPPSLSHSSTYQTRTCNNLAEFNDRIRVHQENNRPAEQDKPMTRVNDQQTERLIDQQRGDKQMVQVNQHLKFVTEQHNHCQSVIPWLPFYQCWTKEHTVKELPYGLFETEKFPFHSSVSEGFQLSVSLSGCSNSSGKQVCKMMSNSPVP